MSDSLRQFNFEFQFAQRMDYLATLTDELPSELQLKPKPSMLAINLQSTTLTDPPVHAASSTHAISESDNSETDISATAVHRIECPGGDVWIRGNCLLCACPECAAPMTIRNWLGLADCWRCQTSIALNEEQLAAAAKLQQQSTPNTGQHKPHAAVADPIASSRVHARHLLPLIVPDFIANAADAPRDAREQELERLTRGSLPIRLIRNGLRCTPAWLVSLILHLIAILILALIVFSDKNNFSESITLSTFLSPASETGGQIRMENPQDLLNDDLELASQLDSGSQELRDVLQKASQDARELVIDPRPTASMVDVTIVKNNITHRPDQLMSFAARDPRVRAEIVTKEGGTTITEAAVARGLRWLASVQNRDGSWSLDGYQKHDRPKNKGDVMGTSLALLPMLGAGQTHEFGAYKDNVAAGLAWLIENQTANGDLRAGYAGQAGMYAHGQAAIVLCEALALTGDQKFLDPARRAIKFIEFAQHSGGGWRYEPGQAGDTSVFGWQMMALQSARAANLNIDVDDATLKLADYFLDQVVVPAKFNDRKKTPLADGAAYCYQPGRPATPAMTAEAILCRMYLGWPRNDPRMTDAVKWLIKDHLPNSDEKNLYYWYYGTQVMHHYGGEPWQIWNDKMRELLISSQSIRGEHAGSWDTNTCEWGNRGGRIYTTSLACCTLEVYYRHLPLFKRIQFDQ